MPQPNRPAVVALAKAKYPLSAASQRVRSAKTLQPFEIDAATSKWFSLAGRINQHVDLELCGSTIGVMARHRGIPTAGGLLALALIYGPGGLSLRQLVESLRRLALATVNEPAMLRCLHGSAGWLESVAERMIIEQLLQRDSLGFNNQEGLALRPYEEWQFAGQAAKHFLLDFMPWPQGLFTIEQEQWLLCARWNFVAATINSTHNTRETGFRGAPTMERVRMLAHLIAAVMPDNDA